MSGAWSDCVELSVNARWRNRRKRRANPRHKLGLSHRRVSQRAHGVDDLVIRSREVLTVQLKEDGRHEECRALVAIGEWMRHGDPACARPPGAARCRRQDRRRSSGAVVRTRRLGRLESRIPCMLNGADWCGRRPQRRRPPRSARPLTSVPVRGELLCTSSRCDQKPPSHAP
jgi:hypothetical protein